MPVTTNIGGVLFVDAGNVWPGKLDFNDQMRISRWTQECKCWMPTTPFS